MERNYNIVHRVKKGENLTKICALYNASEFEIKKINNISSVWEGACLFIPERNKTLYVVQPTDTVGSICAKFSISESELKQKNNFEHLFIGMQLKI